MRSVLLTAWLLGVAALPAHAQALADTLFTWQGYARQGQCRARIYPAPPDDDRTHTVVLMELAANDGPSTLQDARHLAELISRRYGIDPAAAYWVFYWGAFSYAEARPAPRKELFLRATFRRTKAGRLGTPSWRLVTREEVEEYTDRRFH